MGVRLHFAVFRLTISRRVELMWFIAAMFVSECTVFSLEQRELLRLQYVDELNI